MPSPLRVEERLDVQLVDDRVLVPERVVAVALRRPAAVGRRRARRFTGSSRSRARVRTRRRTRKTCAGARGRIELARSCARRATGSARRSAGRAPGTARAASRPSSSRSSVDPARLRVVRIEVHDRQDDVRAVVASLGVADQLRRCRWRGSAGSQSRLQRRVLAADAVHPRDERREAVRRGRGPSGAARTSRSRGTPRCPARAARAPSARTPGRRCRSSRASVAASTSAHAERRPAAALQVLGQDVRRVRPEVRPEVLARPAVRELGEVLGRAPAWCCAR